VVGLLLLPLPACLASWILPPFACQLAVASPPTRLCPAQLPARVAACPPPRSEPPVCLTGMLNVDDCASGKDNCWRGVGDAGELSACVDTFRGFVCRCPQGTVRVVHAAAAAAAAAAATAAAVSQRL
jgi:hypothetical protein